MSRYIWLNFLLVCSVVFAGELDESERLKIEFLKSELRSSNCEYERNGNLHSLDDALQHINRKHAYFEKKIDSALEFIELSATKSTISGKPYYVVCPGEEKVRSAVWLQARLSQYDSQEAQ